MANKLDISEQLIFHPYPHGDPASWVLREIELEETVRLRVVEAYLGYQFSVATAHAELTKRIAEVAGAGLKKQ
jgi:hypothetical protein